jgi:hypothetical protein
MDERPTVVELVRHKDGATGVMADAAGGLTILASGAGLRLVLEPAAARALAARLVAIADAREEERRRPS